MILRKGDIMKKNYIKFGLKLFVIIGLLNIGIFAQGGLSGVRWTLSEINNQRVKNERAYLEINQNRLTGNAGCNRMFGEAEISGKNIKFGRIGTTRMFCSAPGIMKLESNFTNALEKVTRFKKVGDTLQLYAQNRVVLKFRATTKSEPDNNSTLRLEDKKWVLESIKNAPLPKIETEAFINFDKTKGSAGGNTGCNVFGGNYTASGSTISFSNIISTMRACIEDERMNVEREFKNGLQNANRFEIKGEKLSLYQDKKLLLTFRAEDK